jgi:hypothetical protein
LGSTNDLRLVCRNGATAFRPWRPGLGVRPGVERHLRWDERRHEPAHGRETAVQVRGLPVPSKIGGLWIGVVVKTEDAQGVLEVCTTWALLLTKSFSHREYSAGSSSSPTSLRGSFGHRAWVIELPLCGIRKPTSPPVNELVQISNGQRGEWPRYLPLCHAVRNCFG